MRDDDGDVTSSDSPGTSVEASPPADGYGTGECPPAERPVEPPTSFEDAPKDCLEDGVDYGAVVTTSEGTFTVDLLEDDAPATVNNSSCSPGTGGSTATTSTGSCPVS